MGSAVSIAKAILCGFKHDARQVMRILVVVSIAKAILCGFKPACRRPSPCSPGFQSLGRFSVGSSGGFAIRFAVADQVSIARAILCGFKHTLHRRCCAGPRVSIARAILCGFKLQRRIRMRGRSSRFQSLERFSVGSSLPNAARVDPVWVSIARAILCGFKHRRSNSADSS